MKCPYCGRMFNEKDLKDKEQLEELQKKFGVHKGANVRTRTDIEQMEIDKVDESANEVEEQQHGPQASRDPNSISRLYDKWEKKR